MRKYLITTCLLVNISLLTIGQTAIATERIENFCRVWGFLKYYHPAVASGKYDWDSVFVSNIQKVINAKSNLEFNSILSSIIRDIGLNPRAKKPKVPDSLFTLNKTSIEWITNSVIIGDRIKKDLRYID